MSSMFRQATQIPCTVTRMAVRFASKRLPQEKLSKRYDVQLLKNHPTLGVKGQIVSVKPAFMRQKLYPYKYAAYTFTGPKIPVVEKKVPVSESEAEPSKPSSSDNSNKSPNQKEESENVGAMSLDELSNLFSSMRKSSGGRKVQDTAITIDQDTSEITYTASEVREYIPGSNTIVIDQNTSLPITKEFLSKFAFNISGLQIPSSAMRILDNANNLIPAIGESGEYAWLINSPEKKELRTTLVVKA